MVVEGVPHHITQRGNNRQDVFLVDEDRRSDIQTLRDKCQHHGVALLGYCFSRNQPRFLVPGTSFFSSHADDQSRPPDRRATAAEFAGARLGTSPLALRNAFPTGATAAAGICGKIALIRVR